LAKYPSAARALKQRGIVTLRALIDVGGHAAEVNVYRSSGYKLLDDAARDAALNAQYKPYTENGRAVPVYVLIPIEFGS
jgi:protein TonB